MYGCRVDVCNSLLKLHENYLFLKRIITRDKKWEVMQQKRWTGWNHRQIPYSQKKKGDAFLFFVNMGFGEGFSQFIFLGGTLKESFFELLPDTTMINSKVCC